MGFRLLRVNSIGWALIVAGGAVLGVGIAQVARWPLFPAAVVGVILLYLVLRLLDRRAWRRALTVIRVDRNRNQLNKLVAELREDGFEVAVSDDPPGIACRGRHHARVTARITASRR